MTTSRRCAALRRDKVEAGELVETLGQALRHPDAHRPRLSAAQKRKLKKLQEINGLDGDHDHCSLTGGALVERMHIAPHSDAQDIGVNCYGIAVGLLSASVLHRTKQKGDLLNLLPALPAFNTMLDAKSGSIMMIVPSDMPGMILGLIEALKVEERHHRHGDWVWDLAHARMWLPSETCQGQQIFDFTIHVLPRDGADLLPCWDTFSVCPRDGPRFRLNKHDEDIHYLPLRYVPGGSPTSEPAPFPSRKLFLDPFMCCIQAAMTANRRRLRAHFRQEDSKILDLLQIFGRLVESATPSTYRSEKMKALLQAAGIDTRGFSSAPPSTAQRVFHLATPFAEACERHVDAGGTSTEAPGEDSSGLRQGQGVRQAPSGEKRPSASSQPSDADVSANVKAQKRQLGIDVLELEQQLLTELRCEGSSSEAVSGQLRLLACDGAGALVSNGERRQDALREALAAVQELDDGLRRDQGKDPRPACGLVALRGVRHTRDPVWIPV